MDGLPTLKQLRYFAALAETGHYRKAADRVGVSQPSLSLQIANLEQTLALTLVERGRAGAVLTPEGREVLTRARRILDETLALADISEQMQSGLAGTIRLGASPTLGPYLLPNVVRRLHETYPSLRLIIRDGAPRDLTDDLLSGTHDLILTQLPVQSTELAVTRLFREPLRLAVAPDHPLAAIGSAVDADLKGESLLALSSRFTLHAQMADLATDVGAILRQDYEGTSLDALRQMVAMNMGVTFLPALYMQSEVTSRGGDVTAVDFRKGRLTRSIGIAWRASSGHHAGFTTFADLVRSVAQQKFGGILQIE
jgi:LysR family hydrogen peroxide-inducible transcriptional activator